MNISRKPPPLGDVEELVLLVVIGLGADAYGVAVQRRLERDAGRRLALGAVYAALDRLEAKGLLTSALGESTPQRGGRRKRLFVASAAGLHVLRDVKRTRERLWRLVDAEERR